MAIAAGITYLEDRLGLDIYKKEEINCDFSELACLSVVKDTLCDINVRLLPMLI